MRVSPLLLFIASLFTPVSPSFAESPLFPDEEEPRFTNFSVRGYVGLGDETMILGFVIAGHSEKTLLIRAVGPGLASVAPDLAPELCHDPKIALYKTDSFGIVSRVELNDDWEKWENVPFAKSEMARLGAFPLQHGSRDAVLLVTLAPGVYTAHITCDGGDEGVVIGEIYDRDLWDYGKPDILNLSVRLWAGGGNKAPIIGVSFYGGISDVLFRALGPHLEQFGVKGYATDPRLRVVSQGGDVLASNDDWDISSQYANVLAGSPLAIGSRDAGFVLRIPYLGHRVESYTMVVGGEGVVLAEAFNLRYLY